MSKLKVPYKGIFNLFLDGDLIPLRSLNRTIDTFFLIKK